MKLEIDVDDLFVIGGTLCVVLLIWSMASCEKIVDSRVREKMEQKP